MLSEELARIRLRGGYAILAGILLLLGVPLVQSLVLIPTGYVTAVNAIVAHQDFGPLLSWAAAHPFESRLFRVVEVIPFLLALGLPGPLCSILWAEARKSSYLAAWLGRIGFALFALTLFIGMFTSATSATSYVHAQSESLRQAIALDYAGHYALETLLSRVLGGICLTVFLILVSLRMARVRRFPLWFGVVGVLCAALQATTAIFFALGPTQATTPTAGLAFISLALWLLVAGIFLVRMPAIPTVATPASTLTS
ncbi:MAG TPA: hypothetical protein VFS83_03505 [Ktedonobacterales bacterium]|nr:hypothetical protein [Ktedonobacterales bacterium]